MTVLTSDALYTFQEETYTILFTDSWNIQDEGASPRYLRAAEAVLQDLHKLDAEGHLDGQFGFADLEKNVRQMVESVTNGDYKAWNQANTSLYNMLTQNAEQALQAEKT